MRVLGACWTHVGRVLDICWTRVGRAEGAPCHAPAPHGRKPTFPGLGPLAPAAESPRVAAWWPAPLPRASATVEPERLVPSAAPSKSTAMIKLRFLTHMMKTSRSNGTAEV